MSLVLNLLADIGFNAHAINGGAVIRGVISLLAFAAETSPRTLSAEAGHVDIGIDATLQSPCLSECERRRSIVTSLPSPHSLCDSQRGNLATNPR